jgi:hypothetical protein
MERADGLPSYLQLMARTDAPPGSSWGLFGASSDLGTANFLTPERVRGALDMVRRGQIFNLDLPLDAISVPTSRQRKAIEHTVIGNGFCHRDDHAHLYLQATTHFDGLGHVRHHRHGFYNGADDDSVRSGQRLGIEQWARSGIVGRAVLVDLPRYLEATGRPPLDHRRGAPFSAALVDEVLTAQGTARRPGDIVLLRTGWLDFYVNTLSDDERATWQHQSSAGLVQSRETLAWLWDSRTAAVVADNVAVECIPPVESSPLNTDMPADAGLSPGLLHPDLIALLGFVVGELWWLDEFADDCAADGVYEALLVAKPLNLSGGVGSPANAMAIK